MQTFKFHPAKAYIEIPHEILRRLNLNSVPLARKKKIIAEIQDRMDEKLQNIALAALADDRSLDELESVLVADAEISEEDSLYYLLSSIPDFPQKWEKECKTVLKEFIQTK